MNFLLLVLGTSLIFISTRGMDKIEEEGKKNGIMHEIEGMSIDDVYKIMAELTETDIYDLNDGEYDVIYDLIIFYHQEFIGDHTKQLTKKEIDEYSNTRKAYLVAYTFNHIAYNKWKKDVAIFYADVYYPDATESWNELARELFVANIFMTYDEWKISDARKKYIPYFIKSIDETWNETEKAQKYLTYKKKQWTNTLDESFIADFGSVIESIECANVEYENDVLGEEMKSQTENTFKKQAYDFDKIFTDISIREFEDDINYNSHAYPYDFGVFKVLFDDDLYNGTYPNEPIYDDTEILGEEIEFQTQNNFKKSAYNFDAVDKKDDNDTVNEEKEYDDPLDKILEKREALRLFWEDTIFKRKI